MRAGLGVPLVGEEVIANVGPTLSAHDGEEERPTKRRVILKKRKRREMNG